MRRGHAELEAYLRANPRVGDAPLFPSAKAPARPVDKGLAGQWVVSAEKRARLPKLERGLFHPYRRLFAVEGMHLPDGEVAKAGGWRDVGTMKRSYRRPEAVG